jgi:hypothetical protein
LDCGVRRFKSGMALQFPAQSKNAPLRSISFSAFFGLSHGFL